ncbi:MAG TPA: hypothetical protein VLA64_09950, partial [Azonexus sp.]|nr:hypothetical protein [Azonexus sp.]
HFDDELSLQSVQGKSVRLTQESLWWILGRIIPSRETLVLFREVELVITSLTTGAHFTIEQPVGFRFASDNDNDGVFHNLHLESLAKCYLSDVTPMIESAIRARNGLEH